MSLCFSPFSLIFNKTFERQSIQEFILIILLLNTSLVLVEKKVSLNHYRIIILFVALIFFQNVLSRALID